MRSRHQKSKTGQSRSGKDSNRRAERAAREPDRSGSDESLARLLEAITPDNRHNEADWGAPVGEEIW